MSDLDHSALHRLLFYVRDAITAQPPDVAGLLRVALAAGDTSMRFEPSAVGAVVVVSVAGHDLAEVDLRNLLDEDEENVGWEA